MAAFTGLLTGKVKEKHSDVLGSWPRCSVTDMAAQASKLKDTGTSLWGGGMMSATSPELGSPSR